MGCVLLLVGTWWVICASADYLFWGPYAPYHYISWVIPQKVPLVHSIAWVCDEQVRDVIPREANKDPHFLWVINDGTSFGHQLITESANELQLNYFFVKDLENSNHVAYERVILQQLAAAKKLRNCSIALNWGRPQATKRDGFAVELGALSFDSVNLKFETDDDLQVLAEIVAGQGHIEERSDCPFALSPDVLRTSRKSPVTSIRMMNCPYPLTSLAACSHWTRDHENEAWRQFTVVIDVQDETTLSEGLIVDLRLLARGRGGNAAVRTDGMLNSRAGNWDSAIRNLYAKRREIYIDRFEQAFDARNANESTRTAALHGVSNMLGSILFSTGTFPLATAEGDSSSVDSEVTDLWCIVPARGFFSRCFYWDEMFHLLVVARLDQKLALHLLFSYLNLRFLKLPLDALRMVQTSPNNRLQHISASRMKEILWGWLPREVALGDPVVSLSDRRFIKQSPFTSNPPAATLVIDELVRMWEREMLVEPSSTRECPMLGSKIGFATCSHLEDPDVNPVRHALLEMYDFMQDTLTYFVTTHSASDMMSGGRLFYWPDRSSQLTLGSGFDDFPRGIRFTPRELRALMPNQAIVNEAHVDLQAWIWFLMRSLRSVCKLLNAPDCHIWSPSPSEPLLIPGIFWDESELLPRDFFGTYPSSRVNDTLPHIEIMSSSTCQLDYEHLERSALCDPHSAAPCCSPWGFCGSTDAHCRCQGCFRTPTVEQSPKFWRHRLGALKPLRSPHIGAPTILAFGLGVFNENSKVMKRVLSELSDRGKLLASSGLRSLSQTDRLYNTGDRYWRGHIWVNINYLAWRNLRTLGSKGVKSHTIRKFSDGLRARLIQVIESNFNSSLSFYERYDDLTGKGLGAHPFTGWSVLFALML